MANAVVAEVLFDPAAIARFGAVREVTEAADVANALKELPARALRSREPRFAPRPPTNR